MNTRSSLAPWITTLLSLLVLLLLAGCSGDTISTSSLFTSPLDAGPDATVAQIDGGPGPDAAVDSGADAATDDAGMLADAGPAAIYTVGVTVTGLTGAGLILQNNFTDDLVVGASGDFVFPTKEPSGDAFDVTIKAQPIGQTCSIAGGTGVIGTANESGVQVQCGGAGTYALGGQISGLIGTVVLQNNGGDNRTVTANGTFAFPTPIAPGTIYSVSVLTPPMSPSQTCAVSAGVGQSGAMPTTSVRIVCTTGSFAVGVNVVGLVGTGLVLQDNKGDNLSIPGNGAFTFATPVVSGQKYNVSVLTSPASPAQTCTVSGGAGTLGNGPYTNAQITCSTMTYAIDVSVTGLANTTLVLQDNGGDNLAVAADGTYSFATRLSSGDMYKVIISGQQGNSSCSVTAPSGPVGTSDVTVIVNCQTNAYTVSGTISGLSGSLVLQDEGGSDLTVSGSTPTVPVSFGFPAAPNGSAYAITVLTQPASPTSQSCRVASGTGILSGANYAGVRITCTTNSYTVGGTISGLSGSIGLINSVVTNGAMTAETKSFTGNGPFNFTTPVASDASYQVTVSAFPTMPNQSCTVTNGSGAVGTGNVNNIVINCTTTSYALSGTVSGLVGSGLYLQDNGADTYQVLGNGTFSFHTPIASGGTYSVTLQQEPSSPTQTCSFTDAKGAPLTAPVTGTIAPPTTPVTPAIHVTCVTNSYAVGGTISGLASMATLGLKNTVVTNGVTTSETESFTGDGSASQTFTMATPVASSATYDITVAAQPAGQSCTVGGATGTVGGGDVTTVSVICTSTSTAPTRYSVGGMLTGLAGGAVVLQDNAGDNLTVAANGSFAFATPLADGASYAVTVLTPPSNPTQTCTVTGGSDGTSSGRGTIMTANYTGIVVTCTVQTYTITANVSGLDTGDTVTLQDNGADTMVANANTTFAFATPVPSGDLYNVTVKSTTGGTGKTCTVQSGVGIVRATGVTVGVACVTSFVSIGGSVVDLAANTSVTLQNNGESLVVAKNGAFTFTTMPETGSTYDVTVSANPAFPLAQTCNVTFGSGTATANVTNVVVKCTPPGIYTIFAQGGLASHMCAIATDRTLWCWGNNANGQLGDGTLANHLSPEQIGTSAWTAIAVGGEHTCGIQADGTLWCWGDDSASQLGDGTTTDEAFPERVGTATSWSSVATGNLHTCADRTDGTLWCWGANGDGQLGRGFGSTAAPGAPTMVASGSSWFGVTAGAVHTCAIQQKAGQQSGTLWCWGDNENAQLGLGFVSTGGPNSSLFVPALVTGNHTTWNAVNAGANHTCGILDGGALFCWGLNNSGQVGAGSAAATFATPTRIAASAVWTSIACGGQHSCGLQSQMDPTTGNLVGALSCWGADNDGQLGDNDVATRQLAPEAITTAASVTSIALTAFDSYVGESGTPYAAGLGSAGSIGNGGTANEPTFVQIP